MLTAHLQIVGRNHRPFLEACLDSCLKQTTAVPVLYLDNASTDGSAAFVRERFPSVLVYENNSNLGYSGGHNEGLRRMPDTEVVIVLNPDVVLEPDFVARGLTAFTRDRIGAVAPLLLRATVNWKQLTSNDVVDSYGTVLLSSLRAVNQLEGRSVTSSQLAVKSWPQPWGFTGAAAFLRRRSLQDVAVAGEVFDEDLFAYREDVDLSWRLILRGWEIVGASDARATHARSARPGVPKDPQTARLSWRNYYLVLVKDVPTRTLLRRLPWILIEDLARDVQWMISPRLWSAFPDLLQQLPTFLRKRTSVLARTGPVRSLFTDDELQQSRFPDGRINFTRARSAPVMTIIVRREGKLLLLKRGEKVSTYRGRWHAVAGYFDEPGRTVEEKAREELREEIGVGDESIASIRIGRLIEMDDPQLKKLWRIHPVLVDLKSDPAIALDWEHTEYRWVSLDEALRLATIPGFHEVVRQMLPTIEA